ncbi:hypothetical protein PV326_000772, partial [Microctonus aethiopoides]
HQSQFNNNLTEMMKEQNVKLNEQNNKLTEIKNMAKTIADHQVRIKKLEQQNVTLSKNVVGLKRRKGVLSSHHLFDSASKNIIRVNEFLTNEVHSLYLKVKQRVHLSKWKYVWIRDGKIYVRKDDNSEKIMIVIEDDLARITPSLPSQLSLERHAIAEKVLCALDAQHLIGDILDVRQVNLKVAANNNSSADRQTSQSLI